MLLTLRGPERELQRLKKASRPSTDDGDPDANVGYTEHRLARDAFFRSLPHLYHFVEYTFSLFAETNITPPIINDPTLTICTSSEARNGLPLSYPPGTYVTSQLMRPPSEARSNDNWIVAWNAQPD